jgi:hypothetical protein
MNCYYFTIVRIKLKPPAVTQSFHMEWKTQLLVPATKAGFTLIAEVGASYVRRKQDLNP